MLDFTEKRVVGVRTGWLGSTPIPSIEQTSSYKKVQAALYLCYSVHATRTEDMGAAKEFLSNIG